jgi:hypothetical protein
MNLAKDQELRKDVQKDCDGNEFAYGCKLTSQKLAAMLAMECKGPRKGGNPILASFRPSRKPSRIATVGCRRNLMRPAPDNRASISSKKRRVKSYKSPVWTILRMAPGSVAMRITTTRVLRTELRVMEAIL